MASEPQDIGSIPLEKNSDNLDVQIVHRSEDEGGGVQATVRDTSRQRAWSGSGPSENSATTEAMRNFVKDRRAKEYLSK